MGTLSVTDVRPDLPATLGDGSENPEYERLDDRLDSVGDTTVVIEAGTEPATMSFLYDVESSSGNTGRGLIVVKVVRESVPNYPVVDDTVLTAETREDFPTGVDVLTGKATWSGGDVDDLTLSLWGDQRGRHGRRLGAARRAARDHSGHPVRGDRRGPVGRGDDVRVPPRSRRRRSLARAARRVQIRPRSPSSSRSRSTWRASSRSRGGALSRSATDVRASGARSGAACTLESGTLVRYDSGAGAPWVDACQVPVRIAGQDDWTYLSVPIHVRALDPQPELRAGSITVGPGETATFDLRNMTTWQLREDWSGIRYALDYAGSAFEVSLSGSIVTVVGADRAVPGSEEAAIVSVTSHTSVAPVRLILRVGAAPSTLPHGGAVTQQCSQASGSSCTISVIGASGEVNPLPRTPLSVVDVRPTGACVGVSFSVVSPTAVAASWASDAPGATCSASFSVQDAQGRRTNSERDGQVLLDLQGYPEGARERLADRLLGRRSDAAGRPRRGPPRVSVADRLRHPLERGGCRAVLRGRHLPADRGAQRRAARVRGVRAQQRRDLPLRRPCDRLGLRHPGHPEPAPREPGRHLRRGRRRLARDRGHRR